jgi:7,8-dihydro-6-hydroxymethylpterin-pyrophosphokinase
VPHPRLHERRFALEPLAELEPELEIPGRGRVSELLAALDG